MSDAILRKQGDLTSRRSNCTVASASSSSSSAPAAFIRPSFSHNNEDAYVPTDDDRLDIIKSTKSAEGRYRLLKKDTKALLQQIYDNQSNILKDLETVDRNDSKSFQRQLKQYLPACRKKWV